jgi:hypothetical protein
VAHLAFQSDLDSGFFVKLPVSGIDRQHDMDKLMHKNAQHFDGIGNIRTDAREPTGANC